MSYNLKNKAVVIFAIAFSLSLALAGNVKAEEEVAEAAVTVEEQPVENVQEAIPAEDDPFGIEDTPEIQDSEIPPAETAPAPAPEPVNNGIAPAEQSFPEFNGMPEDVIGSSDDASMGLAEANVDPETPKTPIEKYGNTILSRVDNELFNQMSEIEKQTTLLNLELKREEVKNRIEALKAQREKAKQEELDRQAAREKQARDEELKRQKELLREQMRLKEKEMELEKIRQAKILSAYMNEMLVSNQQWVETNAKLSAQIKKLQDERMAILAENDARMEKIGNRVLITAQNAEDTRVAYERKISSFNKQIEELKQIIKDKDAALANMAENGGSSDNPFAATEYIDEDTVDMSKEYAIMDITGKGDNIVAKLVSQDGTTFTVRKGSILKGGEVVVSITDKIITFENHGAKSYLYTGGTVMQYEPTEAFNDATKTPEVAVGAPVKVQEIRNVRGATPNSNSSTLKNAVDNAVNMPPQINEKTKRSSSTSVSSSSKSNTSASNTATTSSSSSSSNKGIASFSQGMMVK